MCVTVSAVDRPTRLRSIPRTALADTAADRKQRPYIVVLAAGPGRYWPGPSPKVAGELTFTSQVRLPTSCSPVRVRPVTSSRQTRSAPLPSSLFPRWIPVTVSSPVPLPLAAITPCALTHDLPHWSSCLLDCAQPFYIFRCQPRHIPLQVITDWRKKKMERVFLGQRHWQGPLRGGLAERVCGFAHSLHL